MAKPAFMPRSGTVFLTTREMKVCRAPLVLQVVAALVIAPAAQAADYAQCHALQERFNRLYISGFRDFDRLMDQCDNTTADDSQANVACSERVAQKARARISKPMSDLKQEWRAIGCSGKPTEPDL